MAVRGASFRRSGTTQHRAARLGSAATHVSWLSACRRVPGRDTAVMLALVLDLAPDQGRPAGHA